MKQLLKKYFVIILGIYVFWLAGIPLVFSRVIPVICENITYNSQYNVSIENPRLYTNIIPTSLLKADSIIISSKISKNHIYIKNFKLKLRLLALLSGNVHLNTVQASEIDINYVIDEKTNKLDKDFVSRLLNTKICCDSVIIKKFIIKLHEANVAEDAIYEAGNINYVKNGRYLKLNLKSDLKLKGKTSVINAAIYLPKNNSINDSNIDIKISNFDIAPLGDYFKNYLPKDVTGINGIVNLDANKEHLDFSVINGACLREDAAKSIIFPHELKVNSGLNLTRNNIIINNAEILSKKINAVVSGVISNYFDKSKPEMSIDVRINNSRIEDFIGMLPDFKTEDIDVYKLKKYKFYGDIIGNISIKGDIVEPSVVGSIFINNGILTKPILGAKGATIKLDFKGKYLNFDVTVPAGNSEKVMVKGGVELYNVKYADMRVWSTGHVDLATAEEKVVPLHEILNFILGPVPIMNIRGNGNIDIIIKGNRKTPHIWGEFNLNNTTTYFNEIPNLVLSNSDASLLFDDENALFNLKSGMIDGKDISINGTCSVNGKFDFDVESNNQDLAYLYKSVVTSTMLDEIKNMIPSFDIVQGPINLKLKVYGNIKDITKAKFNENFFTKGSLELLGNSFSYLGKNIYDTKGNILFDNTNASIDINSVIGMSKLCVKAIVKDKFTDAKIIIPRLYLRDVVDSSDKFQQDIANIIVDVSAKYKGRTDNIEYNKIDFQAKILEVLKENKLKISNGFVSLKNGRLQIKDISGNFVDSLSSFYINLVVDNLNEKPIVNGSIRLKDFELNLFNAFGEYAIIPKNIREVIRKVHFTKGKVNLKANISNNNVNASTDLGGIAFIYTPLNMPIQVVNGSIYAKRNYLGINKINLMADDLPILIDGGINDLYSSPVIKLYMNSKPKQGFIDKYFNNNHIYPLKIKGDIVSCLKLKGSKDDVDIELDANMEKDSSVYYMGATIGDVENAIILNLNMNVLKQRLLKIKEFSYDKLIESQGKRKTQLNMLKVSGEVSLHDDDMEFHDLKIKTNNPTDARIFNLMFKKPNIKQGQFTSNLKFNGKLSKPYIVGVFHIVETNIPFFDTTIKNLSLVFKDKTIDLYSKGEVLGNDITFKGTMKNKLTSPYYVENAELYTNLLDLNYITNKLKSAEIAEVNTFESLDLFDLESIVIKNLKLRTDVIKLRNITAENVDANVSLNEKHEFKLNDFKFNMANGGLDGNFAYNLKNGGIALNINAEKINANDLSIALFDLKNQIYGDLTGKANLICAGSSFNNCLQTMDGTMTFNVKDGRMPKLGSLEYLLKAGNLVKGGITGLSVNSLIDVLTPLKTGEFSDIYGVMNFTDGVADNIEISTKGKDLSLFISGKYNLSTSQADMEVLGILSKKISTMLGPVGNMSINTLFNVVPGVDLSKDSRILDRINKIPGIELNEKSFRKFIAEILGDINGDNYVRSFKWIN